MKSNDAEANLHLLATSPILNAPFRDAVRYADYVCRAARTASGSPSASDMAIVVRDLNDLRRNHDKLLDALEKMVLTADSYWITDPQTKWPALDGARIAIAAATKQTE